MIKLNKGSKVSAFIVTIVLTAILLIGGLTQTQAAIVFQDGFESGNFNNWSPVHGSPAIIASPVANGTQATRFSAASSDYLQHALNATSTVTLQCYFYIDTLPQNPSDFLIFAELTNSYGRVIGLSVDRNSSGATAWRFIYTIDGSPTAYTVPSTIQANTWFKIDVTASLTETGAYQFWVNNASLYSRSNINASSSVTSLNVGTLLTSASPSGNFYLDSITLEDTIDPVPSPTATPTPSPTPTATPTPTAVPTTIPTDTPAPTPAPTPTDQVTNQPLILSPLVLGVIVVIVVVVVAAVVVLLRMRKRKAGAGLPPPPPPPTA